MLSNVESKLSKGRNWVMLGIYVVGFPLVTIVATMAGMFVFNLEGMALGSFGMFVTYFILCVVLLILSRKAFVEGFKQIKSWGKFILQIGLGLLLTFGSVLTGNLIVLLLGNSETAANQELAEALLISMPLMMIFTMSLLGPIVEEIIFRLVLINLFDWKPVYGLIFSSLIFGMFHVIIGGWIHIIPYGLAGLAFGYFYLRYNKNIVYATALHICHNGATIGLVFLMQRMVSLYYS